MPIAQAKAIVHRHAQGDGVKVGMFPDHIEVILHGVGLPDGVVNQKNSAWNELLREEFFEVVHLPLFVRIHEYEIKRPLELCYLHMRIALDAGYTL